ncbi:MFS transporter [uncultured Modestobacter sp.]|uniref:MFS transporter n=1 Tax=uncultured Modestobacter sp. TaxID=380048 RepID=UPI00260A13A0|nr:MFS transporter [uncultured Modestobacter sp.]
MLLLIGLGLHTVVGLARPMGSYRALELGVSPGLLGVVGAAFAVLPVLVALPAGRRADVGGGARVAGVGTVVTAVAACWLPLVGGVPALLAALALLGLGHLLGLVGMQALIAQGGTGSSLDRSYGWFTMVVSAGQLCGPALAGVLAGTGGPAGTRVALTGGAVVAVATVLAVPLLRGSPSGAPVAADRPPVVPVRRILRSPGVGPAMVTSLGVLSATDLLTVYLPALGEERGWSPQAVGALLSLRAAGAIVSRLGLGRMVHALGRERLLGTSLVVSALALGWLALSHPVGLAGVAIAVAGFALGIGQPLSMAVVAARAPLGARATALSIRLMAHRLGQVLVPAGAGVLAATAASTGVVVGAGLIVAVSALSLLPELRRRG